MKRREVMGALRRNTSTSRSDLGESSTSLRSFPRKRESRAVKPGAL